MRITAQSDMSVSKVLRRRELERVVNAIDDLCETYGLGSRIPALRDLMARLNASERTVQAALLQLQRSGRVSRRVGAGTYVASVRTHQNGTRHAEASPIEESVSCTPTIVLVASHDHAYLSRGIELVYDRALALGIPITYEPPRQERIDELCNANDGVERVFLVLGSNRFEACERINSMGGRVVFIGGVPEEAALTFPCVDVNSVHGGYLGVAHLIGLGHRRIAYLMPDSQPRHWGRDHAVREAQKMGHEVTIRCCTGDELSTWMSNPELVAKYFRAPDHPTGVCCWNDHECIRLLTALLSAKIRVPEDISIVGYDNGPESVSFRPSLTTVDTKLEARIKVAIALLLAHTMEPPYYSLVFQPELVVRDSTAQAAD